MARTAADVQAEIDEIEEKIKPLKDRFDLIARSGNPTEGQMEKADRLYAGMMKLVDERHELTDELGEIIRRDERVDAVRSKAMNPANRDGAISERQRPGRRRSPEFVSRTNVKPWSVNGDRYPDSGTELVRHALAAVEQARDDDHDGELDRDKYLDLIERGNSQSNGIAQWAIATSDPNYRSAFEKVIQNPVHGAHRWSREEADAFQRVEVVRAAMSLTDANGGYMVPFTLDPAVILTNSGIADPIRALATVKTIATDTWNGVTSAGVNAEWLAEGSEAADASPTFGQPTITPKKAAAWVFGSYEVLADSGFASELTGLMRDAKARLEGAAFATGNSGATRPRGIVAAVAAVTASIVTSAATNAFASSDVYKVADALRPRDAAEASWIANKRIYSLIRQMDTSGGSAFWANMGMGLPANLLGQPQYEASTMGSVVTTGGNILLAGAFKRYVIVDRVGMQLIYEPMIRSTGNGRPTGQAGWFCHWRVGADVTDADAFRLLQLNGVTATATALA